MIKFDDEIAEALNNYTKSSQELLEASSLCADDTAKQDMVSFLTEDFEAMRARSEGISLMVQKSYVENKDFIIQEIKEVTKQNYDIAKRIRKKLGPLLA